MTPFGYRIVDGKAVIDAEQDERLKQMLSLYLDGLSIQAASEEAGMTYTVARRALSNETYLGDGFYPPLISREMYEQLQTERKRRQPKKPGVIPDKIGALRVRTHFRFNPVMFSGRPEECNLLQWIYSNIESGDGEQYTKQTDSNTTAAIRNLIG